MYVINKKRRDLIGNPGVVLPSLKYFETYKYYAIFAKGYVLVGIVNKLNKNIEIFKEHQEQFKILFGMNMESILKLEDRDIPGLYPWCQKCIRIFEYRNLKICKLKIL